MPNPAAPHAEYADHAGHAAPACSGFEAWNGREYLRDYYTRVDEDEVHTLAFLVRELRRRAVPGARALAFGVGPTVHHLLALSPWAGAIDAADYLPGNLREVQRWLARDSGAHDWTPFTRRVLACEGRTQIDASAMREREALTRARIVRLLHCDAACRPALPGHGGPGYDIVLSCYCAESATADKGTWSRYLANIVALLRPEGLLLMAALRRCRGYAVGERIFPSANIDEHDVSVALARLGFAATMCHVEAHPLQSGPLHRYEGIVLAAAGGHVVAPVPTGLLDGSPLRGRSAPRCPAA